MVSSLVRAPDNGSGCHGFDSRTATQAEHLFHQKPDGGGRMTVRPLLVCRLAELGDFPAAIMDGRGLNLDEAVCV